jgi:hypothetical protein
MARVWSGDTIDEQQVVFCDQDGPGFDGIIAARENGRIVVRWLAYGTWLGLTYATDPEEIAEWLQMVADRALGEVS